MVRCTGHCLHLLTNIFFYDQANFGGNCLLYGKVSWVNTTYKTVEFGNIHACNFVIYVNVIACILYGFGMAIYFSYAIYKYRTDNTIA